MTLIVPVALAALIAGAAPSFDTVYLANGGRVRGTVVEDDPVRGVTIQVPGGAVRKLAPAEISRVEYGDGSAGRLPAAAAPAEPPPAAAPAQPEPAPSPAAPLPPIEPGGPAPAQAAPPAPAPYPPPPPYPPPANYPPPAYYPAPAYPVRQPGQPRAIMLAARLGAAIPGGEAESGIELTEFTGTLVTIGGEAGLRLMPSLMLGAYLELGFGDAGDLLRAYCAYRGTSCSVADVKMGLMGRWVFTPLARQTAWLGAGVGMDVLTSVPNDANVDGPAYSGAEPRLEAGFDFRTTGDIGLGLYIAVSSSRYSEVDNATGTFETISSSSRETHTWVQLGIRGILFP